MDDRTVLEVVPRNSPSLLNVIADDIHAFPVNNNMRLNPRSLEYVPAAFADLPKYPACYLENVQKKGPFHHLAGYFV